MHAGQLIQGPHATGGMLDAVGRQVGGSDCCRNEQADEKCPLPVAHEGSEKKEHPDSHHELIGRHKGHEDIQEFRTPCGVQTKKEVEVPGRRGEEHGLTFSKFSLS
jgi:hypothetical protein